MRKCNLDGGTARNTKQSWFWMPGLHFLRHFATLQQLLITEQREHFNHFWIEDRNWEVSQPLRHQDHPKFHIYLHLESISVFCSSVHHWHLRSMLSWALVKVLKPFPVLCETHSRFQGARTLWPGCNLIYWLNKEKMNWRTFSEIYMFMIQFNLSCQLQLTITNADYSETTSNSCRKIWKWFINLEYSKWLVNTIRNNYHWIFELNPKLVVF